MKPSKMDIKPENIPQELKDKPRWILWKWIERDEKWTKPPFDPKTGKYAESTNPETWDSFDNTFLKYKSGSWDGIGFILNKEYTGIDFDDFRKPDGSILEPALSEIKRFNSYTEISPSATGFKTLIKAKLPAKGHHGESIGVFDNGRYFCITGNVMDLVSKEIEPRQEEINDLVRRMWPEDLSIREPGYEPEPRLDDLSDLDLIEKIRSSANGPKFDRLWSGDISEYPSQSEADMALCSILSFWTGKDAPRMDRIFQQSGLMRDKWTKHGYNLRTINKSISLTTEVYSLVDIYKSVKGFKINSSYISHDSCHLKDSSQNHQESSESSNVTKGGEIDEKVFEAGKCLLRGGMDLQKTSEMLEIIGKSINQSFDIGAAKEVVGRALKEVERREKTLKSEIEDWIKQEALSSTVIFESSDVTNSLGLSSTVTKRVVSNTLNRFAKERNLIEKHGTKRGCFRIVNRGVNFGNFVNVAKEGMLDLKLPLGIHQKTLFFPRNAIVIAGVTGYGKTTFILNTISMNRDKFRFRYFSSEGSDLAFNHKLSLFGEPVENWSKFMDWIPMEEWDFSNIHDKVFPNDINVIDYLEPEGEKTYNIHDIITSIIKNLDKGMAIIATQKRPDARLSAGGVYSAKASSLYLSLDWGTILIFKNRYREEDPNPKNSRRDFNIEGCQTFIPTGDWYNPEEKKDKVKYKDFISGKDNVQF